MRCFTRCHSCRQAESAAILFSRAFLPLLACSFLRTSAVVIGVVLHFLSLAITLFSDFRYQYSGYFVMPAFAFFLVQEGRAKRGNVVFLVLWLLAFCPVPFGVAAINTGLAGAGAYPYSTTCLASSTAMAVLWFVLVAQGLTRIRTASKTRDVGN